MAILALTLLLLGWLLLWLSRRQRRAAGLPGGRVIYSDTTRWMPLEEPLYDPELELVGRPDYLIRQGETVIPVEVKSTRVGDAPYDSHIYQLAAYCRLVQSAYGVRPPYGVLHYANRTFQIDYTARLENELRNIIGEMRSRGHLRNINRSHESAARCRKCGYRSLCDQRLL
ncbi:MAG: Dna2/Cas4 domain-containing protein [Anaerolineae bacterium]|nr:MAG: Dna2/Cas4 domain-containing protein [Anaerolineae bacterium]